MKLPTSSADHNHFKHLWGQFWSAIHVNVTHADQLATNSNQSIGDPQESVTSMITSVRRRC